MSPYAAAGTFLSRVFDATTANPEWMGEEPERLQQLMPA